ncbi:Transcription factor TCP7 [Acorus gramineus]|uniref:Transcription factor TCP7 n=1 Tax=Acorus gramineus TaxID=55184 RepID=A0AAV8ZY90_ACOGR|nr:Transcription factor TCP7 [Acorus gramineus]
MAVTVSLRNGGGGGGGGSSSSGSVTTTSASLDYKPIYHHHHHLQTAPPPQQPTLTAAPFILGKRLRTDDESDNGAKDDGGGGAVSAASAAAAAGIGGVGVGIGPAAGFWALPARPDFGQVWSFAAAAGAPELIMPSAFSGRFAQPMGEASAARVGNYLPLAQGHLNLLASLSGPPASSGRREDDHR